MRKLILLIMSLAFSLSLGACADTTTEHEVFVTVYPLEYVVQRLFENTPYTVGIVPGVTSHSSSVDWSPKEIIAMTKADYLFYVGANYDQYIDLQINSIFEGKDVELVKLENNPDYITFIMGVIHDHDHEHEHDDEEEITTTESEPISMLGYDPHFWISPLRVKQAAMLVYDKLLFKYPDYEDTIIDNYDALVSDLDELGADFLEVIGAQTKPIMTSTNIYGYLHEDYGLEYFSISPGYHEETEQFTSAEKEAIVAEAVEYEIYHIIYERNVTSPLSNAVFDTLAAPPYNLNPVKLEYDILQMLRDQDRENGDDYLTVMYKNLELIETATNYQPEE